jgi:hypothetical protein
VEAQSGKMGIKMFFRQGEMTTLLKGCTAGLERAIDLFKASSSSIFSATLINRIVTVGHCGSLH